MEAQHVGAIGAEADRLPTFGSVLEKTKAPRVRDTVNSTLGRRVQFIPSIVESPNMFDNG